MQKELQESIQNFSAHFAYLFEIELFHLVTLNQEKQLGQFSFYNGYV